MNIRTLALLAAVACQYEAPVDPNAPELLGAMQGEIVFGGVGELGPAYVILYDAANPGPPAGTGSPLTFTAIAPDAFSGDEAGIDAAPFALTRLEPASYLVTGLVDVDSNFNPLVTALAGATCGDWVGAHLTDLVTQAPAPVTVAGGEQTDDVTVLIGQQMPIERPVFDLVGGAATFDISDVRDQLALPLFRLRATELELAEGDPPFSAEIPLVLGPTCTPAPDPATCGDSPVCACASVDPCGTAQYLEFVDADADGLADPNPDPTLAAAGVLDVWPHVFLESLADLGDFEVDGKVYEERWVTQAFPLLGEIATGVVTYGVTPAQAAAALAPAGVPVPTYELSVTFVPVFLHFHAGGAIPSPNGPYDVVDLRDPGTSADGFPAGAFQLTVISFTGQTWTMPNEAALSLPTQGAYVTLVP